MKKVIFILVIAIFTQNIVAQGDTTVVVPQPVLTAFTAQFPKGQLKKWEQRKEGYIADFRQDGKKFFAYYAADGTWKGTESPINWTKNLPAEVKEGWRKSIYYNWYVEDIKKIETPDQPLYTLHVNNGVLLDADHHDAYLEEYVLFFSPKGDLVRKDKMP
jgi:hypothetical protein